MKILEFDYWVGKIRKKALKITEWCTKYLNHTEELERLTKLKILDNKDYLKDTNARIVIQGIFIAIFTFRLGELLLNCFPSKPENHIFQAAISLFCSFFLLSLSSSSMLVFGRWIGGFSVVIAMLILAILNGGLVTALGDGGKAIGLFKIIFKEYPLDSDNVKQIWGIFLIFIVASSLSNLLVMTLQDIFDVEKYKKGNEILLLSLGVLTFIVGVELNKISPIGIFLLSLLTQTAFITWYADKRLEKESLKAQNIFQKQLLSTIPNYQELKKCYYYGGEKYKEKLLSNREFLEVILEAELKSLNDLSNYEIYSLYKAYAYKKKICLDG